VGVTSYLISKPLVGSVDNKGILLMITGL
jgi:hypothetical protein